MRPFALETFGINQTATHLEGTGRRVVLVLDHNRCAKALGEQRPRMRWRRRNRRPHDLMRALTLPPVEHRGLTELPRPALAGRGLGRGALAANAENVFEAGTPSPGSQARHSRSPLRRSSLLTAAEGGLCLSPQAGRG